MSTVYEKYLALPVDKGLFSLARGDMADPWFCYPVNAEPIGFEGNILYCFLPEYGETVFACNPESAADGNVYPIADNFEDLLRLILACGTVNPAEQVVWMSREQFDEHLSAEKAILTHAQKAALAALQSELGITPMDDPYGYVRSVQQNFDAGRIQFSDEYYDVTGIENPRGAVSREESCFEFAPVVFSVPKKDGRS